VSGVTKTDNGPDGYASNRSTTIDHALIHRFQIVQIICIGQIIVTILTVISSTNDRIATCPLYHVPHGKNPHASMIRAELDWCQQKLTDTPSTLCRLPMSALRATTMSGTYVDAMTTLVRSYV